MKKILTFAFGLISLTAFTQRSDTLKASSRNFATELNVNPFQGNLSLNNAIQQIKVRYFVRDNFAFRVGFTVNSKKNNNETTNVYGTTPITYKSERKSFTTGINLGVEKHFKGTRRLSPYVAVELTFVSKNSSQNIKNGTTETSVDGAWIVQATNQQPGSYEERGYFKFGGNLVCGFDYYLAKNFFLGYEFLFQISKTVYKDINVMQKSTNGPQLTYPDYNDSESFIGPTLINGIRLGFVF